MRIKVAALATLLTIAVLWTIPAAATATPTPTGNPCGPAFSALEAGQLAQAEKLYTGLSASQACARQGLIAVHALFAAQQLYAAGMSAQAAQDVNQALNTVPLLTLPPGIVPSNPPTPWYVRLWHGVERVWSFFGNPIPGSLLAAFVLVAVSSWWAKSRPRLHLHSFAFGATPVSGADPDEFGDQIRDELLRLAYEYARTDDDRPLRLDLAGPYEDHLQLDTLFDGQSSLAKILLGFAAGPLKRYKGKARLVVGVLQPRIRLRLKITTVDGEPEEQTLISRDRLGLPGTVPPDDPAAQFEQLAMPAAAWIILTHYPDTLGGTRSWESFAEFAAGWAWERDGHLDKAEERFEAALRTDPQNLAAKFNLGSLLVQTTGSPPVRTTALPARRQRGLDLLRDVRDQTEGRTGDLLWYRPRYVLPLAVLDSGVPPTTAEQAEAAEQTRELIVELIDRDGGDPDVPPKFVENGLGASLVLLARQSIQTTDDPREVVTTVSTAAGGTPPAAIGAATPPTALAGPPPTAPGGPPPSAPAGTLSLRQLVDEPVTKYTSAQLFDYARDYCQKTPQMTYNMYKYQKKWVSISRANEERLRQGVVTVKDKVTGADRLLTEAEKTELGSQWETIRQAAEEQMVGFVRVLEEQNDPIVNAAAGLQPVAAPPPADDAPRADQGPDDGGFNPDRTPLGSANGADEGDSPAGRQPRLTPDRSPETSDFEREPPARADTDYIPINEQE